MLAGSLAKALKRHQWEGVRFLWTNMVTEFPSKSDGRDLKKDDDAGGCILGEKAGVMERESSARSFLSFWLLDWPV